MTKDEMLRKYAITNENNYDIIQEHIKEAMQNGESNIIVGIEGFDGFKPDWICTWQTKNRLKEDGFRVEECDYNEWMISWDERIC